MAPRRILVTGAGGFVAGHLLPLLRAAFPEAAIVEMGGRGAPADLMKLAGVSAEIASGTALLRRAEIPTASGDAAAARAALDWAPAIAWEQALADVLADWRARVRHEEADGALRT